jgi:ArsR family transcriptional regulator
MKQLSEGGVRMDKNMEEKMFQMHAEVCKSMANPTRLKIMNLLREEEKSVEELRERLKLPKANLSQHLSVLRQRRIVSTRRAGLNIYYKVANPKMIKACDILREVLFEQLQEGERLVRGITKKR